MLSHAAWANTNQIAGLYQEASTAWKNEWIGFMGYADWNFPFIYVSSSVEYTVFLLICEYIITCPCGIRFCGT